MRADSAELAARMMTRAFAVISRPDTLSMNETPFALPCASKVTARAIALGRMSRLPVAMAGGRCTVVDW